MPIEKIMPGMARQIRYEASVRLVPFLLKPVIGAIVFILLWLREPVWEDVLGLDSLSEAHLFVQNMPLVLLIASITFLVIRLAQAYAQIRLGHRPPLLVRQIITLISTLVGGGTIVASLWHVPVGSLLTTSGLLVAVVGIALKNMISDLFNGISLPVKIGDWVEVTGMRGQVVEISWRATKLVGIDGVPVIIPNTHFIIHPMRNFNPETGCYIDTIQMTLPTSVTAHQAERILTGAAQQMDEIGRLGPLPEARIVSFNDTGVVWELRYPVADAGHASHIRHLLQRTLLRDFYYSGISMPVPQIQVHQLKTVEPQVAAAAAFLHHIPLFFTLNEAESAQLSQRMRGRVVRAGVSVVQEGDSGDSLFIVQEGLLTARVRGENGETELGKIRPGQFFGEMSLLTGAERSATVTTLVDSKLFEIDRASLAPIMQDRPEIAARISRVLAERQLANAPKLESQAQMSAAEDNLAQQILTRISAFFRLPARPRYSSL